MLFDSPTLAELRILVQSRDVFPARDMRALLGLIDQQHAELVTLRAEHANAEYWRKAFERLRDSDARETRDRLDRVSARALGLSS